jgi:hypothetical protein
MKKGILLMLAVASLGIGLASAAEPQKDVFKGKLFPPNVALLAENQVKKKQMTMLVRLKNQLTAEQVIYLEPVQQ